MYDRTTANAMDIRPFISMVFSTVWISITEKPKPRRNITQPSPVKSMFEVKHYSVKRRQKCKPVCTICKNGFRSWKQQAEHWKHKHVDKDEYKCKEYGKELSLASNFKKHVLLHQEEKKKTACEDCGQRFSYPSQLRSHLDVHSKSKIFKCPSWDCRKVFKCSITLKWHQEKHNKNQYKCPNCPYITDLQHYLKDHLTRSHGPILVCEFYVNGCDYTTHCQSSFTRHENWCEYKPSNSSDMIEEENLGD